MRPFLFFLLITFSINPSDGQGSLSFEKIIPGSFNAPGITAEQGITPYDLEATPEGGHMEVSMKIKKAGNQYCIAKYRFEWEFSEPVHQLTKGQTVEATYRTFVLRDPCPNARAGMIITEASGFSPAFKNTGIRGVRGISIANKHWIYTDQSSGMSSSTVKVMHTKGPATIKLTFQSTAPIGSERLHYEVIYLFESQ